MDAPTDRTPHAAPTQPTDRTDRAQRSRERLHRAAGLAPERTSTRSGRERRTVAAY